ncbi:alpha/beta hydrolase family protein [Marinicella sediminis]|uniref:Alpha/beta hydrolase family protein n=1 Tax=Marinicella sediminis TaxID=1792834 RepID=A0ABV7JE72_9GAMM|nr:prolyl oligopeptidase family serine peptidase [Marinicella sediminis]
MNGSKRNISRICSLLMLLLLSQQALSLKFNQNELLILKGSDPELADDEGYLFLSVESNQHFTTVILDHVDSGKRMRFSDMQQGENHALVKLKAGKYYWKSLRGYIMWGLSWIRFDKDEHVFEVKPGVINYPGTWLAEVKFSSSLSGSFSLKSTNKATLEWPYFKQHYQQYTGQTPLVFSGHANDPYFQYLPGIIAQQDFESITALDYREIDKQQSPIKVFDIMQGVDQAKNMFPKLADYLDTNRQVSGEINPQGDWILLSSLQDKMTLIEVVNINTFKSYVVFKESLPDRARISSLRWIDNDSFIYDLDYEKYSFSHVMHLSTNQNAELVGAEVLEIPIAGKLLDPLIDQENKMFFANFRLSSVNNNDINGLYFVDTSSTKSIKKSFKKTYKKTRKFNTVIDWLTDQTGYVRSAIEVEYDKKNEQVSFHHWFLPDKTTDDWVRIRTSHSDDDVPLPVKLSADETFFYAFTDAFGDKVSVHKYSTKDYSHIGPFIEDPYVDIESLIEDPSSREIIGYTHLENGWSQRKFLQENNDLIRQLRKQNPDLQMFVRQHIKAKELMLIYAYTQYSKGAWYLYQKNTQTVSKLLDENPVYENLPKGDNHAISVQVEDGIEVEGFLVVPSIKGEHKPPLVVIPHGGPIGVRDTAANDETQHFLASKGIASLKVNYRGSSGYGKEFIELGKQQWGEKIESDIHAVVLEAIEQYALDSNKVCAMGSSYGGYSAVMLTILYPDVYLCAISLHGVMDLPLLFGNQSLNKNDKFFEELAKIVGDPRTEMEKLMKKSPFYLADKISRPIKLFQGLKDNRVTVEHALRMQQMFTLFDMEADLTVLMNEGHSLKYLNSNIHFITETMKFLDKHLDLPIDIPAEKEAAEKNQSVMDLILK